MSPDRGHGPSGASLVVLVSLAIAVAGCASKGGSESRWWRKGTVVQTMQRSAIPADVDSECARATNPSAPSGANDAFALVRFKAGRAPYVKLFPVDEGLTLNAGDRVDVEPGACKLRRQDVEAS